MKDAIALVGLPGAGKSTAAEILRRKGYGIVRLGDITDRMLKEQGLAINEGNERQLRESLRSEHGMDAYARLSFERVHAMARVVIDGIRSPAEADFFRKRLGKAFRLVRIDSNTERRHERLSSRRIRPLSRAECIDRDKRELDVLGLRQTLEKADVAILNNGSPEELESEIGKLLL